MTLPVYTTFHCYQCPAPAAQCCCMSGLLLTDRELQNLSWSHTSSLQTSNSPKSNTLLRKIVTWISQMTHLQHDEKLFWLGYSKDAGALWPQTDSLSLRQKMNGITWRITQNQLGWKRPLRSSSQIRVNTTLSTTPWHQGSCPVFPWTPTGMVTPPPPCAAHSNI